MPADHAAPADAVPARPPGLLAAFAVLAGQAAVLLGFAAWMVIRHGSDLPSNEQVYSGSVVYLVVLSALVALVAASLWRRRGWAYGAAVFVQILAVPIAWQMGSAGFWAGAIPLAVAAVVALAGLMARPTRLVLGRGRWDQSD